MKYNIFIAADKFKPFTVRNNKRSWLKHVTGIDKNRLYEGDKLTLITGFCYQGHFIDTDTEQTFFENELYIYCGTAGRLRYLQRYYTVFTIGGNGGITVLGETQAHYWAENLFPIVEKFMNNPARIKAIEKDKKDSPKGLGTIGKKGIL